MPSSFVLINDFQKVSQTDTVNGLIDNSSLQLKLFRTNLAKKRAGI